MDGVRALLVALGGHATLSHVNLSSNFIRPEGSDSLAAFITQSPGLRTLVLSQVRMIDCEN